MNKTLKELLKNNLITWNGIKSLMEGGWRLLPVRLDPESIKIIDEELIDFLVLEIAIALERYHINVSDVKFFSVVGKGDLVVQIKE